RCYRLRQRSNRTRPSHQRTQAATAIASSASTSSASRRAPSLPSRRVSTSSAAPSRSPRAEAIDAETRSPPELELSRERRLARPRHPRRRVHRSPEGARHLGDVAREEGVDPLPLRRVVPRARPHEARRGHEAHPRALSEDALPPPPRGRLAALLPQPVPAP